MLRIDESLFLGNVFSGGVDIVERRIADEIRTHGPGRWS